MITRYILLAVAVSVFGNQELEIACPYGICGPKNPSNHSDKPTPAVPILGNQDLEIVCPSVICRPENPPNHSDKPAPKLKILYWRNSSDLEVLKVTPSLENLNVKNCRTDFKMDIFPPLPTLTKIEINNCSISELQKHQFENVVNLLSLTLTGNSIEILFNETFHKLSQLTSLRLENNLIRVLPEGVFDPLEGINSVNLNNNNISFLPRDIFMQNKKLKTISLSGNPMKIVSLNFPMGPENIVDLDLSDCVELRDLRLSISVTHLYLTNSGVERLQITGSIREIKHENSKVTRVDLSGTYFRLSVVPVLWDMPSLEWLDLTHTSKPSYYSYFELEETFPNLRFLNMTANKLNYIPRNLPIFGPNLTTLDFSHNLLEDDFLNHLFHLHTAKEEEGILPNLRFLYMAHNKLTKIPRNVPFFGPNLIGLDLSHNLLEDISVESFTKAHNLQGLYLAGNRLKSFAYLSVCDGLISLKRITLYDNKFNATFYHNMTKYLGDNGLSLFQK